MASTIQTLDLNLLPPGKMSFDIVSGGIEGGRNLQGFGAAITVTGAGLVVCKYTGIKTGTESPSHLRYLSRIARILNGGVRTINVPIMSDYIAPLVSAFTSVDDLYVTVPHDDDTPFDDDSEYIQPTITARVGADAALNAGTITIILDGTSTLEGGEIFSIDHPTKGNRVYSISDIDSATPGVENTTYVVGIRPTLREAVVTDDNVNFIRPLCQMRLTPGTSIPLDVEAWWDTSAEISFIEAA